MSYLKLYSLCPDDKVVAAWESQVARAKETPWLAEALARRGNELFPRFATRYAELRALPRGARKALQRKLAHTRDMAEAVPDRLQGRARRALQHKLAHSLAGAALLLALGGGTASAALIAVTTNIPAINDGDGKCSLIEAIVNANNDDQSGSADCAAGSPGLDTIVLPKKSKHPLTAVYGNYAGPTGLPLITSFITIDGNGSTIMRNAKAPEFRIFAVNGAGHLRLRDMTVSGGALTNPYNGGYYGGAIHVDGGMLTVEFSKITGNRVVGAPAVYSQPQVFGGGINAQDGSTVTIMNSTISGNLVRSGAASDGSLAGGGGIDFYNSALLNISNSTISGNTAVSGTSDTFSGARGGGINAYNFGTANITNSVISGNKNLGGTANGDDSEAYGGGIHAENFNSLTITNSTLSGNLAKSGTAYDHSEAIGGGLNAYDFNSLVITNSTISGNTAMSGASKNYASLAFGGGLSGYGFNTAAIWNSTISGNTATSGTSTYDNSLAFGGGLIFSDNNFFGITNSTISGNLAKSGAAGGASVALGGGLMNYGGGYLWNSTITGNRVVAGVGGGSYAYGGGIYNESTLYLSLSNSLISGNQAPVGREVFNDATLVAYDYNLFGFSGSSGVSGLAYGGSDIVPGVPLSKIIGPLANNGGPTKTHALKTGSPAINAVYDNDCPSTDQRGVGRPIGSYCDIGSFEK